MAEDFDNAFNFDDAFDFNPPQQAQAQPAGQVESGNDFDKAFSFDNAFDFGKGEKDFGEAGGFSPLGAFAHQAVVHAPEMAAGGASGILAGGAIGTAIGGLPGTVAGLAGGLAAGFGGGYLAAKGKDWILDQLGLREGTGFFSRAQEQAAEEEHPYASFAGDMLDTLLTGAPQKGAGMAARALGTAIMGGTEAAQEYVNEGTVNPLKVAGAGAMGAYASGARPWVTNLGEQVAGAAARVAKPRGTGTGAIQNPVADANNTTVRPDLNTEAANKAIEDTPGDVEIDTNPSMTKEEADLQNDITKIGRGVSEENPPVPENPKTGNMPDAAGNQTAPMLKREASRPTDPDRDYKTKVKGGSGEQGVPNQAIETAPTTTGIQTGADPAIVAALKATEPPEPPKLEETGLAPLSDWQKQNRESIAGLAPTPLGQQVKTLAEQGRTAQEISDAVGGKLDANEVRILRDHFGIQGGPVGGMLTPTIPQEKPPPPAPVETGIPPQPRPMQQQQQAQPTQPNATVAVNHPRFGKIDVPPHVAHIMEQPDVAQALNSAKVVRDQHVPYVAGSSNDRSKVYIDSRIPPTSTGLPKNFRTEPPMVLHEIVEKTVMSKLIDGGMEPGSAYKVAHWGFAEPAEDAWYRARGIEPTAAEKWWSEKARQIGTKKNRNPPADLYAEPYPHDNPLHAHDGGVATQHPSQEELQKAVDILRGKPEAKPEAKEEGEDITAAKGQLDADVKANPDLAEVKRRIETLPDEQRAQAYRKYAELSKNQPKETTPEVSEETPKKVAKAADRLSIWEGGPTARDQNDLARKQKTLKAVTDTHKEFAGKFVESGTNDPTKIRTLANEAFDAAKKANDNRDPLVRPSYVPTEKGPHTDAYQWLRAVKKIAKAATPANIKALRALEAGGAKEKAPEGPTVGQLDEQTKKIEDEITKRPYVKEAGAEIQLSKLAEGEEKAREFFPPFKDETESTTFNEQANELRDWFNALSDEDYRKVTAEHPEFKTDVNTTSDPAETLFELQKALNNEEVLKPEKKSTGVIAGPSKNFEPTKPGAKASTGKSLDKNSPEFQRLAAEALVKSEKAKGKTTRAVDEEIAAEKEKARASNALSNSWESFKGHVAKLAGDEEGSFVLPEWMRPSQHDLFSPEKNDATKDYGDQLTDYFHGMTNRITQAKANLLGAIRAMDPLTPAKQKRIIDAEQSKSLRSLPKELQQYYAEHIAPLKGRYNDIMQELKSLDEAHHLGLDLPELHAGIETAFVPRIGKDLAGKTDDTRIDPVTGQTLSNFAGGLQERKYLKLVPVDAAGKPKTGDRLVFIPGEGQITIKRNGAPQIISKNIPDGWKADIGNTLNLKVKGQPGKYVVDHASIDEIRQAAGKDSNGKWREDYHENSPYAWVNRVAELERVLERERLLIGVKTDPKFIENTTTSKEEAAKRGYSLETTKLPQFAKRNGKDLFMPDNMRWALDDYYKRGYTEGKIGAAFDRAATGLIKTMYFFGPVVHALNEADKWAISRGFDWLTPGGYKSLIKNGYTAIKSVSTQDAIQQVIRDFGGNPMLGHTLTRDLMPQVMRHLAVDMTQNASKWDPVAKIWNTTTPQLMRRMYDASSKPMWWASDVLLTHKFLENQSLHGMSPKDAIADAHQWIDSYRMPTTVGPKNEWGRAVAKALQTPSISLFGPYHYGLWHSFANMTKNLINGATPQAKQKAMGQLMMAGVMAYTVYPLLQQAAQWAFGNENTQLSPRGLSLPMHKIAEIMEQKKGPETALTDVFTPSIPLKMFMEFFKNEDWKGQPIMERGSSAGAKGAQLVDWAARSAIPPYGQISPALLDNEATPGSVASHFAQGLVGAHTPTPKGQRYQDTIERINAQREKAREKKPQGVIENLYNTLTSP